MQCKRVKKHRYVSVDLAIDFYFGSAPSLDEATTRWSGVQYPQRAVSLWHQ